MVVIANDLSHVLARRIAAPGARRLPVRQMARGLGEQLDRLSLTLTDTATLIPKPGAKPLAGVRVKHVAMHPVTKTPFVFKPLRVGDPQDHVEAAIAALATAAGDATVPVKRTKLQLPGGAVLDGYAKPLITNQGHLSADATRWTRAQTDTVLADHVRSVLLGNPDGHVEQYLKVGAQTVDIDWDQAFFTFAKSPELGPIDRHEALHWFAPTVQNHLYRDFVRGRVELDFAALFAAVKRYQALSPEAVSRALAPFLDVAFADGRSYQGFARREDFLAAFGRRQASLPARFKAFVAALRAERAKGGSDLVRDARSYVAGTLNNSPFFRLANRAKQWLAGRKA